MRAPLTTLNAEIKTAAVEIQTLTISGKQVTLAVFRQLLDEPVFDADYNFVGLPWGTVNYCPGGIKCLSAGVTKYGASLGHRFHIVWQKGRELRRSAFPSTYQKNMYPHDYSYEALRYRQATTEKEHDCRENERQRAHAFRLAEIEALPQLFIAV